MFHRAVAVDDSEDGMTDSANAWTEERLAQLRKLWDEGLSISQIGDALGVSRNAIAGKAHRMGLPKRPSPISKTAKETKKPAKPKPAAEPENLPLRLELRKLKWSRSKCCWPSGDPKLSGFTFCGDAVVPGKPYCLKHCGEAYTTSRDSR